MWPGCSSTPWNVRFASLAALLLAAALLVACARAPALQQQEAYVFGTRVEVMVYGEPEEKARRALAAVLQEFDRLHRAYHAWQPSELTALNDAIAGGETAAVSPELAAMLKDAQGIAAAGEGLFDPAIGRLVRLWGFQSDEFKSVLPPRQEIEALVRAAPRMADLIIEGGRVASRNPAVMLDLGGYAKGYALDRAVRILREQGVANALVNIGGNVMALGSKGPQPWRVGIQDPRGPAALASLPLHDGEAIGTSGDYQRYFELDGERYCHLIDPRAGYPVMHTRAVTVLVSGGQRAGTLSDAASKPLFVAGAADWRRLAGKLGIDQALRVDGDGSIEVTPALRQRLEPAPGVRLGASSLVGPVQSP